MVGMLQPGKTADNNVLFAIGQRIDGAFDVAEKLLAFQRRLATSWFKQGRPVEAPAELPADGELPANGADVPGNGAERPAHEKVVAKRPARSKAAPVPTRKAPGR